MGGSQSGLYFLVGRISASSPYLFPCCHAREDCESRIFATINPRLFELTLAELTSMAQDFDETSILPEDQPIDTGFKSRIGLPSDCPIRPQLRQGYEFIIATEGSRSPQKFAKSFRCAAPLRHWTGETLGFEVNSPDRFTCCCSRS